MVLGDCYCHKHHHFIIIIIMIVLMIILIVMMIIWQILRLKDSRSSSSRPRMSRRCVAGLSQYRHWFIIIMIMIAIQNLIMKMMMSEFQPSSLSLWSSCTIFHHYWWSEDCVRLIWKLGFGFPLLCRILCLVWIKLGFIPLFILIYLYLKFG